MSRVGAAPAQGERRDVVHWDDMAERTPDTLQIGRPRMGRRSLVLGCAGSVATLWTGDLLATQTPELDLEQLLEASDSVSLITPRSATSRWVTWLGGRRIVTDTRVSVEEHWLGEPLEEQATVRTLGGEVGDLAQIVHAEAHLQIGQPSLLFLKSHAKHWIPTALGLSHFNLDKNGTSIARSNWRSKRYDHAACRRAMLGRPLSEVRENLTAAWQALERHHR